MKKKSIWQEGISKSSLPSLDKDLEVDVLIIGGGLSGFSTLFEVLETSFTVCLLEGRCIGDGVTGKSTAKLNYLQGIVYSNICKNVSYEAAKAYLSATKKGISLIRDLIESQNIDCNLERVTSSLYGNKKDEGAIQEEYQFLKNEGCSVFLEDNRISAWDTYVFHPLKYLHALKRLCLKKTEHIYEHSLVTHIKPHLNGYLCEVNHHQVFAKHVVLACHYPFSLLPFFLPVRSYIEKSYIMAVPVSLNPQETFITTYPNILSKRFYTDKEKTYSIILNGSHNICNHWNENENFRLLLQSSHPDFVWSNEDIMTSDMLPLIGKIGTHLYLATGYNTWGMAMSRIAGEILKDLICEKENVYASYFDPYRPLNLGKMKQYPLNLFYNLKSFVKTKFSKKKYWYPSSLTFSMIHHKSVAKLVIHQKEYMVYTTCPHMGCTLIFNEFEGIFECPCHASSFNYKGECIKGPSVKDITYFPH